MKKLCVCWYDTLFTHIHGRCVPMDDDDDADDVAKSGSLFRSSLSRAFRIAPNALGASE